VLSEILFVQLQIHGLIVQTGRQNDVAVLIMIKGLVDAPPPTMLLKQGDNQLRVVSTANEALVELKLASLKMYRQIVVLVHQFVKFLEYLALHMNDELFRLEEPLQVTARNVLRNFDLKVTGKGVDRL